MSHPFGLGDDGSFDNMPGYSGAQALADVGWGAGAAAAAAYAAPVAAQVGGRMAVSVTARAGPGILSWLGIGGGASGVAVEQETEGSSLSAVDRVNDLAMNGLSQIQRDRFVTLAITETEEGINIVSANTDQVQKSILALLQDGEIAVSGLGHAEVTGIEGARSLGLTPVSVAVSRNICSTCQTYLMENEIVPLTPLKP